MVSDRPGAIQRRLRHSYADAAEAQRAADAELGLAGRDVLRLDARLAGFEPGLFAGGTAELSGLRPELEGEWHVRRVEHSLQQGLITGFALRRARP